MLQFVLSYPPSANRYWRKTRNGRIYVSPEATAFKNEVKQKCKDKKPYTTEDVVVIVSVYRPRKVGDLPNRTKVLYDALQGYAFKDDKQIVAEHTYRYDDKQNPRVEVTVIPQSEFSLSILPDFKNHDILMKSETKT